MKIEAALALFLAASSTFQYRTALPGYHYEFPRDHFSHPDFQTEWWYYTGNLRATDGHRFGFELTFFRHGVDRGRTNTVWDVQDVWLAHLALSDIDGKKFLHTERLNRSGAGLAGADAAKARVWNGNWSVERDHLGAIADQFQIDFTLHSQKPPVIHGVDGVSQKAPGPGRASHYISLTRIATKGAIVVNGQRFTVEGLSWMDHEFFTHQLESNQTGWDWFSLQFDDGSELMLVQLRRKDGSVDPFSTGTYIDPNGRSQHLTARDFVLTPGNTWASAETHGKYPIEWSIRVPSLSLNASLSTKLPNQELASAGQTTSAYWEGAVEVAGTKQGRAASGRGYLEMTGYAGAVRMGE